MAFNSITPKQGAQQAQPNLATPIQPGTITLSGPQLNELGLLVGGRSFQSADDIIKLFKDSVSVRVNNAQVVLAPEDLQAMKDQYATFSHLPYAQYVDYVIQEALSQFLWGSTKGILV